MAVGLASARPTLRDAARRKLRALRSDFLTRPEARVTGAGSSEASSGMDNVQFSCGHCGQLLVVGVQFAGQQVRCPHCQQVLTAPPAVAAPALADPPAPAAPPLQETQFNLPGAGEQESIF